MTSVRPSPDPAAEPTRHAAAPSSGAPTLNLGILAHVDAGKTSLTERLLYLAGVIDHVGRVDHGDTQTDTLALERRRGITIRAAVASFRIGTPPGQTLVNLLDTPGHPDFIAEVERVLGVLDGAVLVVSAVEGVQAQTRVLLRTLRRLGIPTLIFVNKVDRGGADPEAVLASLDDKLGIATVGLSAVADPGAPAARVHLRQGSDVGHVAALLELLTRHDDELLRRYLDGAEIPYARLRHALAEQTRRGLVHPVLFGSAMTGAGIDDVVIAIAELLPTSTGDPEAEPSATVFKIERGRGGEKLAYVRVFDGQLHTRTRLPQPERGRPGDKITAIEVYDGGPAETAQTVGAGQIARVRGLASAQVGDPIGRRRRGIGDAFARPTLETAIRPGDPADAGRLHAALTQLAEQDPLIGFRQLGGSELALSLYGEVQQEVIADTLLEEYGIEVSFADTHVICLERVVGVGHAVEFLSDEANPYFATIGLRVEPGPPGSGARFTQETAVHGTLPLAFVNAIAETVSDALRQGPHGWEVVDVVVTLTHTGYYPRQSHAHAQFDKAMSSVGSDFRGLTPLVLAAALQQAGTVVCEPVARITLTVPTTSLSAVLPALGRLGGIPDAPVGGGAVTTVTGELPVARVQELTAQLPALTSGEGSLETTLDHFAPVYGEVPRRERIGPDPLARRAYLLQVKR